MTGLRDAWRPLLDLVVAARGERDGPWSEKEIRDALMAAHAAWPFRRALKEVTELLLRDDAEPRDITHAARRPAAWQPGSRGLPGDQVRDEYLAVRQEVEAKAERDARELGHAPGGDAA